MEKLQNPYDGFLGPFRANRLYHEFDVDVVVSVFRRR